MSQEWFAWYTRQVGKKKQWATYRGRCLCPCCYMPTLDERASYDICSICSWEDDGQDSDDADLVRGGPNHSYSLQEARENFIKHFTMYRPSDTIPFDRQKEKLALKEKMYRAFTQAIGSDSDVDWEQALKMERVNWMSPIEPLNAPATEEAISKTRASLSANLPEEYVEILEVIDGIIADEFVLYSCEDLIKFNDAYRVKEYLPGYVIIGHNNGDREIMLNGEIKNSPVFLGNRGAMEPEDTVRIADNLEDWMGYGCQLEAN